MSLFNDLHHLSDSLKLIEELTSSTKNLTKVCKQLNNNIERLIVILEQQSHELPNTTKNK